MNRLLVILGFSANDAIQCERLLDLIAAFNNKVPKGDLLIVAAPDTHGENRVKCKIAAEVAFQNVELLEVGWPAVAHTTKYEAVNNLWLQGMMHATRCYQSPALWIEPDCVFIFPTWLDDFTHAYYSQPRRYLGSILASADGKQRCLSRVAIYPRGAGGELKDFCSAKTPFEIAAGTIIVPRAGKSKLFQQLAFTSTTERSAIREDAVLLHHDKAGVLLSALMDEALRPPPEPLLPPKALDVPPSPDVFTKLEFTATSPFVSDDAIADMVRCADQLEDRPKLDGRTKAGRAAREIAAGTAIATAVALD